jgi:hypothetical protein
MDSVSAMVLLSIVAMQEKVPQVPDSRSNCGSNALVPITSIVTVPVEGATNLNQRSCTPEVQMVASVEAVADAVLYQGEEQVPETVRRIAPAQLSFEQFVVVAVITPELTLVPQPLPARTL